MSRDLELLLRFAAPHRALLLAGAALMLCESAVTLALPWVAGLIAGSVLQGTARIDATAGLLAILGLFAAQAVCRFGNLYLLAVAADRIVSELRVRLYDHLQSLPLQFFHRGRLGDTLALLTNDVYLIAAYIGGAAVEVVPLALTGAVAAAFMLWIRPDLGLAALVLVPVFYLVMKISRRSLRPLAARLQEEEANAIAMVQENLSLLPAIKTFTREPAESARFRAQMARLVALSSRHHQLVAAFGPFMQFVAAAGLVCVLALAGSELAQGRLQVSELVTFVLYAVLFSRPVGGLADIYGRTQSVRGALDRLQKVMAEPTEPEPRVGRPMPRIRGEVELRGVSFGYEGRPLALRNLNLRIAAGETVALVGPNGAGKSTIAHLLLRLHSPSDGAILVDGIDVATASLPSLRAQIGIVPQQVMLFNASVRDNIAYGRTLTTQAEIEAAARAAGAHEFVLRLPQGYETTIGDRGVRLSGGQQQRIALARALFKDPAILILDEATSMFDPVGEHDFIRASRGSLRGRTVVLITHRPASLAIADRIVHMDQGHILRIEPSRCSSFASSS